MSAGVWLLPILSLVVFIWLLLLYNNPTIYASYGGDIALDTWLFIGLFLVVLLLVVLFLVVSGGRSQAVVVAASPEVGKAEVVEPIYEEAEVVGTAGEEDESEAEEETGEGPEEPPIAERSGPRTVEYPPKVTGGVYGDTMIPVGNFLKLKLRTMLVRSCLLCDYQEQCFPDAEAVDMTKKDFNANVDCRDGIKEK